MILRLVLQTALSVVALGLVLFVSAGTLRWPGAWAFLALLAGFGLGVGLWLARVDPDLLVERMRPLVRREQRGSDRMLMLVATLAFTGWLAAMGLEVRRFGVRTSLSAQGIGALLIVACYLGAAWSLRENRFAIPAVEIQTSRGHTVATTGPYAFVRHPMYASALLFFAGAPLLLGALWGLAFVPAMLLILAVRALREERMLLAGLPGYGEYAARVRARLLPGVW